MSARPAKAKKGYSQDRVIRYPSLKPKFFNSQGPKLPTPPLKLESNYTQNDPPTQKYFRSLHKAINVLIAFDALANFAFMFTIFIDVYYVFVDSTPIRNDSCWYLLLVPYTLFSTCFLLTLFIGLDRLISILKPNRYEFFNQDCLPSGFGMDSFSRWLYLQYTFIKKIGLLGLCPKIFHLGQSPKNLNI